MRRLDQVRSKKSIRFLPYLLLFPLSLFLLGSGVPALNPRIVVVPEHPQLGEPFTVAIADVGVPRAAPQVILLTGSDKRLAAATCFALTDEGPKSKKTIFAAILAVPSTAGTGMAKIRVESGDARFDATIEILPRDFIKEDIPLDEANTELRTRPDPQKIAESEALWKILTTFDPSARMANGTFDPPVEATRRTAFFGDRRVYNYIDGSSDTSIHAGIDFGVPSGTEVHACAAGKVVFSGARIVTGNSVVVEHLPGVFSLYYHMERRDVSVGDTVAKGEAIGLSGSTGLSTGPHLHWEVRVSGEAANPDAFLARAILDKELLVSKISENSDRLTEGR